MKSLVGIMLATAASFITFAVARQILRHQLRIGPPTLIAAVVAALAFIGLTGGGSRLVTALLLPFEALAVTLLVLPFLFLLTRAARSRQSDRPPRIENDYRPRRQIRQGEKGDYAHRNLNN